jgi:N-acyl homoserine lactone hydrolase
MGTIEPAAYNRPGGQWGGDRRMNRVTSVRRLFVLLCGFEILPKSISTRERGSRFILSEPVCVYLIDTEHGWVLIDTGLAARNFRDPALAKHCFHDRGWSLPVVRAEHELTRQLLQLGLEPANINHVILTHLHYDHAGNIGLFSHARISVQRREFNCAFDPAADPAYFVHDFSDPQLKWNLVEGDWEVMPGFTMLDTRGHTPGHQSAVIELRNSGPIVLPSDVGDLQENFDDEILPGVASDDAAALAAIRRLKAVTSERHGRMLLFHDPVAIQSMRLSPEFYD